MINIATETEVMFFVFQSNGIKVSEGTTNGLIDVSTLENGIYIIQIQDGDAVISSTFVKK